jgi:putative transposase
MFPLFSASFPSHPHYLGMPRMPRAVLPGAPHHLIQRGVAQQNVFFSDTDREVYLRLAAQNMHEFGVRVWAYCLMSNHVHWVVVPEHRHSLSRAFGRLHGHYAQHMNTVLARHGHFWQNRFFSCAMDEAHTWAALRYVERNPVRAGLVGQAEQWPWSSASARLGTIPTSAISLDLSSWRERFTAEQWLIMLSTRCPDEAEERLRKSTYTGRPAGDESFVARAEAALQRKLAPGKGGRPKKVAQDEGGQTVLFASGVD